jgi:hypothetical protein
VSETDDRFGRSGGDDDPTGPIDLGKGQRPSAPAPRVPAGWSATAGNRSPTPPLPGYQTRIDWVPLSRPTNTMATTSLVLGVCSFFICPLLGIAAVIVGNRARREIRRTGEQGDGLAAAGVAMGYVAIGLSVLGMAIYALFALFLAAAATT